MLITTKTDEMDTQFIAFIKKADGPAGHVTSTR